MGVGSGERFQRDGGLSGAESPPTLLNSPSVPLQPHGGLSRVTEQVLTGPPATRGCSWEQGRPALAF